MGFTFPDNKWGRKQKPHDSASSVDFFDRHAFTYSGLWFSNNSNHFFLHLMPNLYHK